MRFTLIIPAWNEEAFLPETLERAKSAISACSYHGNLVVVDNNSTDNTAAIARAAGATVVFEPINQIARARNRGASIATDDVLVFLDADTYLTEDLLQTSLDALASNQVVGGGVILELDQPANGSALRVLNLWNAVSKRFQLAAGSFIFCRRDAFEAIGGFDAKVYAGEEILLTRKLKRWGKKHGYRFQIISDKKIITSARKLQWYSTGQLLWQFMLILIPGALYSKRLCKTWYDSETRPRTGDVDSDETTTRPNSS